MGMPIKKKTYNVKSRIGDSVEVTVEKVGTGDKADILYRVTRGKDRRVAASDTVVLFREELEELSGFLKRDFLNREFPE
jgi:hypothetical protein